MFELRGTPAVRDLEEEVDGEPGRHAVGRNLENVAWNGQDSGKTWRVSCSSSRSTVHASVSPASSQTHPCPPSPSGLPCQGAALITSVTIVSLIVSVLCWSLPSFPITHSTHAGSRGHVIGLPPAVPPALLSPQAYQSPLRWLFLCRETRLPRTFARLLLHGLRVLVRMSSREAFSSPYLRQRPLPRPPWLCLLFILCLEH